MEKDNTSLLERVLKLYRAPFSFKHGNVIDARNSEVLHANDLSKDVGEMVADALNYYWGHNELRSAAEELMNVADAAGDSLNTSIMNDAIERVRNALNTKPALTTPHTYGAFSTSFYVENKRKPTPQEIFDAGMRSGFNLSSHNSVKDNKE